MTKRVEVELVVTGTSYGLGRKDEHSLSVVQRFDIQPIEVEGDMAVRGVALDPSKRVRATLVFEELE